MDIILASTSPIRRRLLSAAGVRFHAERPAVDEAALKMAVGDIDPALLAKKLALAKASSCIRSHYSLVIGADQVLSIDGKILAKPVDFAEARQQILKLRGKTHQLFSAVACVTQGDDPWSHIAEAKLSVRNFSDSFLDWYLAHAGERVLEAVGAYKLEEHGSHLFDAIEGDYFTVLGLPLLPLLDQLRSRGVIPA